MLGSSIEDIKSRGLRSSDNKSFIQTASKYAPCTMQMKETPVMSLFVYLVNEVSFQLANIVVPIRVPMIARRAAMPSNQLGK